MLTITSVGNFDGGYTYNFSVPPTRWKLPPGFLIKMETYPGEEAEVVYADSSMTQKNITEALGSQPQPWNGPGLPPIGLPCEAYYHNDTRPGWKPFTLKYLSVDHVVFDGLGEVSRRRKSFADTVAKEFRPLRTTEQIAAGECRRVMEDMARIIDGAHAEDKTFAEALYDAGYRKFEIVEGDACPD